MKDPRAVAAKWKRNASAAGQAYVDGIMSVKEAPGVKAAQQQDKMLRNFTEAITSGRWRDAVSRISLTDWQNASTGKGKANYQTGVSAAEQKVEKAMAQLLPIIEGIKNNLPPRGDLEQNLERANQFARQMHEARR